MPLDIPDGTACFVDSNIFYYALTHTPGLHIFIARYTTAIPNVIECAVAF